MEGHDLSRRCEPDVAPKITEKCKAVDGLTAISHLLKVIHGRTLSATTHKSVQTGTVKNDDEKELL